MSAMPRGMYRDPLLIMLDREARRQKRQARPTKIKCDPFGGVWSRGEQVMTREESDDIEELLGVWFRWTQRFKAMKGHARVAPYCRGHQHEGEDDHDVVDMRIEDAQAQVVEACMDSLTPTQRGVIGVIQSNRESGQEVFRYPRMTKEDQHAEYQRAKVALMPRLRAKGMAVGERRAVA